MTMFGASIKDGVLAFNQFSWGVEKLDVFGIALGVGLDIYDSIQRGVSLGSKSRWSCARSNIDNS